jgi:hypothetical protein
VAGNPVLGYYVLQDGLDLGALGLDEGAAGMEAPAGALASAMKSRDLMASTPPCTTRAKRAQRMSEMAMTKARRQVLSTSGGLGK